MRPSVIQAMLARCRSRHGVANINRKRSGYLPPAQSIHFGLFFLVNIGQNHPFRVVVSIFCHRFPLYSWDEFNTFAKSILAKTLYSTWIVWAIGEPTVDETVAILRLGSVQITLRAELTAMHESLGTFARSLYNDRRLRDKIFQAHIFGEPGWDILLDLFACESEGRPVSVGSACIASAVPLTTALRHVSKLEELGFITRSYGTDRRRVDLSLTTEARTKISELLFGMLSKNLRMAAIGGV
jgi:hypothetical protein